MSHSPTEAAEISPQHPYAQGASQLNRLVREGRAFSGNERNCCYLNTKGGNFANLSTISGIDFPDDGRAIAASDWDFDGDLDFWVANRTGPQLRWMRNDLVKENHFVAVRLVGVESNRDAIGATARLFLSGEDVPLIKGLRAGEGFLAQGSKWLHFGLGENEKVEKIVINWPNGSVQQVEGLEADRYYKIEEGDDTAHQWEPPTMRAVSHVATQSQLAPQTGNTQLLLGRPSPLPPLRFKNSKGELVDATNGEGRPRLVNIWATWCRPCLSELGEWTEHEKQLRESGVEILALSVDSLGEQQSGSSEAASQVLKSLGFPFQSGEATNELLDVLQLVNNAVFRDDHRRLPVPTSVLIDARGRLAAFYKGPVQVERILSDVGQLSSDESQRLTATLPFPGRWMGLPGPHRVAKLVDQLWSEGFVSEAKVLLDRMPVASTDDLRPSEQKVEAMKFASNRLEAAGRFNEAEEMWRSLQKVLPQSGEVNLQLGVLAAKQNDMERAIKHFLLASEKFSPPRAAVHLNLAQAYRKTGQVDLSEQEFRKTLALEKNSALGHSGLGLLQASQARFEEAADSFRTAASIEPDNIQHLTNLAAAYLQLRKPEAALEQLELVLEQDPKSMTAQVSAAEALVALQRPREAIARLMQVTRQQPDAAKVWLRLSELNMQLGEVAEAVKYLERTHALAPEDPYIAGNLAWILSTTSVEAVRDGERAVQLATSSVRATKRKVPQLLDAMAAAYAEAGMYEDADKTASEAIDLLGGPAANELAQAIDSRRKLYRQKKPFRLEIAPEEQ